MLGQTLPGKKEGSAGYCAASGFYITLGRTPVAKNFTARLGRLMSFPADHKDYVTTT